MADENQTPNPANSAGASDSSGAQQPSTSGQTPKAPVPASSDASSQPKINRFDSPEKTQVAPSAAPAEPALQASQTQAKGPIMQPESSPSAKAEDAAPQSPVTPPVVKQAPTPTPAPAPQKPAAAPAPAVTPKSSAAPQDNKKVAAHYKPKGPKLPAAQPPAAKKAQPPAANIASAKKAPAPVPAPGKGGQPPVPPPAAGAPGSSGHPAPKKKKAKKPGNVILGIFFIFVFLFALGMILLVVMLAQNPTQNPLLDLLGIDPASLKNILTGIINSVFGFLSFLFLIVATVGFFRLWTAPKGDKVTRRSGGVLAAIGLVATVVMVTIWVSLFLWISQLQIGVRLFTGIITNPVETTQLNAPVSIQFSAEGIRQRYRTTDIIAYNWDFDGDGKFDDGSGLEIEYNYTDKGENNGIFNVGVEVVFAKGKPAIVNKQVTISNILPEAKFSVTPGLTGFTPFNGVFDASTSVDDDGSISSYEWDFDDDGRFDATGRQVEFDFDDAGSYRVLLQVTDNNGATSTHEEILEIETAEAAQVVISSPTGFEGTAPFEVTFDGSKSAIPGQRITAYSWSFGDGTRNQSGRTVKHTFTDPGTYSVALEVATEDNRKESTVQTVTVSAPSFAPQPAITTDIELDGGKIVGQSPLTVKFSAEGTKDSDDNIVEYEWSFEDPSSVDEFGEEVTHTFNEAGNFTVTLTVIDADDNRGVETLDVELEERGLVMKVNAVPPSGVVPLDVTFDAAGSFVTDDSEIISYTYDFDDGSPVNTGSANQTHRYSKSGTYVAKVSATTTKNETATQEIIISVIDVPLQAKFDYRPTTGSAPLVVFFDAAESTGDITSYTWDFDDSGVSRVKNPQHTFSEAGSYTVRLEVQDASNNISSFERTIVVE